MILQLIAIVLSANAQPHFDTGSTKPNQVLIDQVNTLCDQIESEVSVIVEGHTDLRGGDSYNLKLSKGRADSVKELLLQCKNKPKEIRTVGMGKNFPVSDNHDENRRVVIHLIQQNSKTVVISEAKTEVIKVPVIVERKTTVVKKVLPEWHVTSFLYNGNYNLTTQQGNGYASAELERSWSAGVLVEKRVSGSWYLGGGVTFDRQVMLGVGKGF